MQTTARAISIRLLFLFFLIGDPVAGQAADGQPGAMAAPKALLSSCSMPACKARDLELKYYDSGAVETGVIAVWYSLTNISEESCFLQGYPKITRLSARGQKIPFSYDEDDFYNRTIDNIKLPPKKVTLQPKDQAIFYMSKYRCDEGGEKMSPAFTMTVPEDSQPLSLKVSSAKLSDGYPAGEDKYVTVTYCGPHDAGSTIGVSRFEPVVKDGKY